MVLIMTKQKICKSVLIALAILSMALVAHCTYTSFDDNHNRLIYEKTVDRNT